MKFLDALKNEAGQIELLVLKGVDKIAVMITGHDDPRLAQLIAQHGAGSLMVAGKTLDQHQADADAAAAPPVPPTDADLKAAYDNGHAAGKAEAEAAAKVESDAAGELFATVQAELEAATAKVTDLTAQLDEATKPKDPA